MNLITKVLVGFVLLVEIRANSKDLRPQSQTFNQFPKCCPPGHGLQLTNSNSEINCTSTDPTISSDLSFIVLNDGTTLSLALYNETKMAECQKRETILPYQLSISHHATRKDVQYIQGKLLTRTSGNHQWEELTDFCLDHFIRNETNVPGSFAIWSCNPPEFSIDSIRPILVVYIVALTISCFFLLLIVVVYGALYDVQNVHGWTIATFSLCLFLWFFFLIIGIFYSLSGHAYGTPFCVAISIVIHFFNIASFSWMTILNFDVWSTIRLMTPRCERTKGLKRFLIYSTVGFGFPFIVVLASLIVEHNFEFFDESVKRPQYGRQHCYLDDSALLYYEFIVLINLFIFNLTFGLLTVLLVYKYQRDKRRFNVNPSRENQQSKASRFGKLFVIIGITWVFESVSNIVWGFNVAWYLAIFDLYNILQTLALFWIFVCRREIKEQLEQKFPFFQRIFEYIEMNFKWENCRRKTETDDVTTTPNATLDT